MTEPTMTEQEWLASLQPGSPVVLWDEYHRTPQLATVARVTATQVRLNGMPHTVFSRTNGTERGVRHYHRTIVEPTPKLRREVAYHAALLLLRGCAWGNLPRLFVREMAERVKLEQQAQANARADAAARAGGGA